MQDPWDIDPLKERKFIIIKKEEKQEPERAFVPSCTVKQAVVEGNFIWPDEAFPPYYDTNTPQRFSIIDEPIIGNYEDINMEINTIIRKEKEEDEIVVEKKDEGFIDNSPAKDWKKQGQIVISYSLIDKMYFKGEEIPHCPAKIYGDMIGLKTPPTDPMIAGNLFETLLLGGGRDGEQTLQLERKQVSQKAIKEAIKAGQPIPEPEMRIDEIRIRMQVERSKILFFNHQIQVIPGVNTQIPIYKIWNGIKIWGHLDLFSPVIWKGNLEQAIIDTKLTGNLSSNYGKYGWGDTNNIDFTQAIMYYFLFEDIDYDLNPYLLKIFGKEKQFKNLIFLYFVCDYKVAEEKLDSKFFEVQKTTNRIQELKETIRRCHATIEMYVEQGWPANPTYELCKNCVQNYKSGGKCNYACNNIII